VGFVFLHKVRMQFEVVLSSANWGLVSYYWDPSSAPHRLRSEKAIRKPRHEAVRCIPGPLDSTANY
jgi:hypothetical protein